jgi:glucose/arabinose dehydrogenase
MMKIIYLVTLLFLYVACSDSGRGGGTVESGIETTIPPITLNKVATGFINPVQVLPANDGTGRLFVVEKRGVIKIFSGGVVLPTPFLSIIDKVNSAGSEQGLLSVAFSPDFESKKTFYIHYTSKVGIGNTAIEKMNLESTSTNADPNSAQNVLTVAQPFTNHNGGQLAFGPDGFLYIGLGDGGGGGDPQNNAQNRSSLLGKILRIDVESTPSGYQIPSSNISGNEVWSFGFRNPWRFSFDRGTGSLFIADVGEENFEEINVQTAASPGGINYGWPIMEGLHCFREDNCNQEGLTLPILEYTHADGNCSITGGFVYRGAEIQSLQGVYLYGDYCSGRIWGLRQTPSGLINQLLLDTTFAISSFGEDEQGNLYVVDFNKGDLYKVALPALN